MTNLGAPEADQSEKEVNMCDEIKATNLSIRMVSIDRVSKLPVVEEVIKFATRLYGKVRRSNCVFHWSLKKAETTATKVANTSAPMLTKLQTPIEKLDAFLCTGLDYVESKVPGVKLRPDEIYVKTKQYVIMPVKPCMNFASALKNYGARKLEKVRRVCGGSEPGVSEASDTQGKTCDAVQSLHSPNDLDVTLGQKSSSNTSLCS